MTEIEQELIASLRDMDKLVVDLFAAISRGDKEVGENFAIKQPEVIRARELIDRYGG